MDKLKTLEEKEARLQNLQSKQRYYYAFIKDAEDNGKTDTDEYTAAVDYLEKIESPPDENDPDSKSILDELKSQVSGLRVEFENDYLKGKQRIIHETYMSYEVAHSLMF